MALKTIIADPQYLFVEGFIKIIENTNIEFAHIQHAQNAQKLKTKLEDEQYDLLFLELNLPDINGIELIPELKDKYPDLKICILSSYTNYKLVKTAFQNGADGFYSKLKDSEELASGIEQILANKTFLSTGLHVSPPRKPRKEIETASQKNGLNDRFLILKKLTPREMEILALIAKAFSNREIADKLYISDQTVGVHRKNIMRKFGVRNTINLIKFTLDNQLVDLH